MKTIFIGHLFGRQVLADAYRSSSWRESIFFFSREFVDAAQVLFTCLLRIHIPCLQSVQKFTVMWLTRSKVPSKSSNACFGISLVFMSRWLVRFVRVSADSPVRQGVYHGELCSPPESTLTFFMDSSARNKRRPAGRVSCCGFPLASIVDECGSAVRFSASTGDMV